MKLLGHLQECYEKGKLVSITELMVLCDLDPTENVLGNLQQVQQTIDQFRLVLDPPANSGNLDEPRWLKPKDPKDISTCTSEIEESETAQREFKSTLLTNLQRKTHDPGRQPNEYFCENVLHSSLKSLAGFSNSKGGILFIGVADDGTINGIEEDYATMGVQNFDQWQLRLQDKITSKFSSGLAFTASIDANSYEIDGKTLVRIVVTPTERLEFVKDHSDVCKLYMRLGTRTESIEYAEIEKYFTLTRK